MSERWCWLSLALPALLACNSNRAADTAPAPPAPPAPDRLAPEERLPEAETAFGLPMPAGMHLTRHFNDAAYFSGPLPMDKALEHVRQHLLARQLELTDQRAVFARAYVKGAGSERLVRVEVSKTPRGSQVYVQDITPPPSPRGLSEEERWRRAGRKPDGTLLDPNSVY